MRKINRNFENPFDNILLDISKFVSPFFKKFKHTPNAITIYSAITAGMSMYSLYKKYFSSFSFLFIISYFFDNLDGYFARCYNMVTKFGDLFDHGKDTIMWISTFVILYYRYTVPLKLFLTFVIVCLLCIKHIACQETIYNHNNDIKKKDSLYSFQKLCGNVKDVKYTRYFGGGSVYLFLIGLVYFSK
jgi:hypothetical protein